MSGVDPKLPTAHLNLKWTVGDMDRLAFMRRNPRAVVNVWKEALLVAMATGDVAAAAQIAHARVAAGDSGGFSSGGKSFFERAQVLCKP